MSNYTSLTDTTEFVVWYDNTFLLDLQPADMTVDNLGSLATMADFALVRLKR